jgi:hypothetical protein
MRGNVQVLKKFNRFSSHNPCDNSNVFCVCSVLVLIVVLIVGSVNALKMKLMMQKENQ